MGLRNSGTEEFSSQHVAKLREEFDTEESRRRFRQLAEQMIDACLKLRDRR